MGSRSSGPSFSGEGGLTIAVDASDFQLPLGNAPFAACRTVRQPDEIHRFMWRNQGKMGFTPFVWRKSIRLC
ncbi:MAG: hypothetical protein CMI61_15455 [Parvibaculum sp.]|jgi:hypothetical protein|nr:hypothetical protein [Parvibaculum sp.]HCX68397.1 hypothetical protein [Rhodobiaceae bacterium]